MVDILVEHINQLNMTIQNIFQLNQQSVYQLRDEFNETMQVMQQNIASNDLTLRAIKESSQNGSSCSK